MSDQLLRGQDIFFLIIYFVFQSSLNEKMNLNKLMK